MKTKAAVAWKAGQPLTIETVDLQGPKFGEVLVEIMATGICHTDAYTLDGFDSEGIFPSVLGHEGAGIVREVPLPLNAIAFPGAPDKAVWAAAGVARISHGPFPHKALMEKLTEAARAAIG